MTVCQLTLEYSSRRSSSKHFDTHFFLHRTAMQNYMTSSVVGGRDGYIFNDIVAVTNEGSESPHPSLKIIRG